MNRIILIILLFFLTGCGEPKIDTGSDESFKKSIQKIRRTLPQAKRESFDQALQTLVFSQVDLTNIIADGATGLGTTEIKVKEALDGKTGHEILLAAKHISEQRKEKERTQALNELKKLMVKKEKARIAKEELKNFQVEYSSFYKRPQNYGDPKPIIELDVVNWTSYSVSRAYFKGTLASPNRKVPWHEDTFNYEIPGGLEPGETGEWTLAPNMFSDWGKVTAPEDAVFSVEVLRLDGPDGKPIYSSQVFSNDDAAQLRKLKKEYNQ